MVEASDTSREVKPKERKRFFFIEILKRLVKEKPLGTVGGIIVLIMLITGILADVIAPYGYNDIHLADSLSGPTAEYILGTDNLGRDLLSRIIYGARISMIVGLAGASLNVTTSLIIGGISGFLGGKVDMILMRFVDAFMCFPSLFVLLTIMAILQPGLGTVIIVLGFTRGIVGSRVIRGAVIGIKENVYVEAARAIGAPTWRILTQHILPNILAPVIILFTISMGAVILMEATISFLGFGIPPPTPSWGGMLSGAGRQYMFLAPWLALWPGLALSVVVYGINMLGDALRDILDPRLRGGLGRYGRVVKKKGK